MATKPETARKSVRPRRAPASRGAVPDSLDLRDRLYLPRVQGRPPATLKPVHIPVLDQGETNACTGFALASLLQVLTKTTSRSGGAQVSPWMLYSMARRYDAFGGHLEDAGSSVRGAMKGWQKHGACALELWPGIDMPPVPDNPLKDWWLDAVRRPLGAYYRIDASDLPSIHSALLEVGAVVASVACHPGWDEGHGARRTGDGLWEIPHRPLLRPDGHAFVIVGYNDAGFVVHNSWGVNWGTGGRAVLTYQDWLENAMDCWVGQIGVVTEVHREAAPDDHALGRTAGCRPSGE